MSLNSLSHAEYLYKTEGLLNLLQGYVAQWQSASTVERRVVIEARALSTLEDILDNYIELPVVTPYLHANVEELNNFYTEYQNRISVLSAKIRLLGRLFVNYYNTQQIKLLDMSAKVNRIKQKYATLGLWNTTDSKYVFSESFINHDNLLSQPEVATELAIFESQGVVTLPIKDKVDITIKSIVIGAQSNGQPGNSNLAVESDTGKLTNLTDRNPNHWFEYERLDAGPLKLELLIKLSKKEIINYLSLDGLAFGLTNGFFIKDVQLHSGQTISLRSLLNTDLPENFWVVNTANSAHWECVFLPVEVDSLTLILEQGQVEIVNQNGRTRQRYALALNEIALARYEFHETGALTSEVIDTPAGLYSTIASGGITPANPLLFNLQIGVSTDQKTWDYQMVSNDKNTTFLLNGDPTFQWNVQLTRLVAALANNTDYSQPDLLSIDVESLLTTVSPFESPTEVSLVDKPRGNQVFVMQPKMGQRGDKSTLTTLGKGQSTTARYSVPFDLLAAKIKPQEVNLFVGRQPLTYSSSAENIAANHWSFSDDYKEILLADEVSPYSSVQFYIDPEQLVLSEDPSGYVGFFSSLFDPDKENIKLSYLAKEAKSTSLVLPKKELFKLEHKNILPASIRFHSKQDLDWVGYTTREAFIDSADDYAYYVDTKNGIIYLNTSSFDDQITLSYKHKSAKTIPSSAYDVLYEGMRPVGVRINKTALETETVVDDSSVGPQGVFSLPLQAVVTRQGTSSTRKIFLSRGQLIKHSISFSKPLLANGKPAIELEFIDGESEFYGLVRMLDEPTIAIASGSSSYVSFALSARGLTHLPLGVSFSDPGSFQSGVFVTLVSSAANAMSGDVGDYYIAEDGMVVVNIGAGQTLTSGINISYWYKDPNFDPSDKYSVDYEDGLIYTIEPVDDNVQISYKAGVLQAEYSIAQALDTAVYNPDRNTVKIKTELLNKANNLVKIFWANSSAEATLARYQNYFSPILSLLKFRFN